MDIVEQLKRQAEEIAADSHSGWGNTMVVAAEEIEQLRDVIAAKNGEVSKLWKITEKIDMAELDAQHAKEVAKMARNFLYQFNGDRFFYGTERPQDRAHLGLALEYVEALSAMVLNLADRLPPNDLNQGQLTVQESITGRS